MKLVALACASLLTGCAGAVTPTDPKSDDPQSPTQSNPGSPSSPSLGNAKFAGVYQANAPIDFTQNGVLPGIISPLLGSLAELHDHPGKAIIDFASAAGVGFVKSLPGFVKSILSNLLDSVIGNSLYANHPLLDEVASTIMGLTEITKSIELHNSLTIHTPASDGTAMMELQINNISYTVNGGRLDVTLGAGDRAAGLAKLTGTINLKAGGQGADADLGFGDPKATVAVPIGSLLLQAAGPLFFEPIWGVPDLKGVLQQVFPCGDIGQQISDGVTNATGTEFFDQPAGQTLCNLGVGAVGDLVTSEIQKVHLSGISVVNARAHLYDQSSSRPNVDRQADRIADGTWTWRINSIDVPSTFFGDRIGNAN
jgi:hypothetical protein